MPWKTLCRKRFGAAARARRAPSIEAWSLIDHSHSRFIRNWYGDGKTLLLTVVSIWKTLTWSASSLPIRQAELCRWLLVWSMNEWDATIVLVLWWCLSDLYDARPMAADLCPPSIATRLTLT